MPLLTQLNYDNSFARLPAEFQARTPISPLRNARLAAFNPQVASLLDLDDDSGLVDACNGQVKIAGWQPTATLYAGHQFGHYVPQLGDGRALLVAEVVNPQQQRWDLQLKGSGPTPFSRRGDGRAVLRSSIREYLASIALNALSIPSTQALCLIASDEPVYREQPETGALIMRVAPSHLRFGHFEYFAHTGQHAQLAQLLDYLLTQHYPQLKQQADPALALFEQAVTSTAQLFAAWQAYGFTHGVLNTDNMSILGLTLDYGPFAFIENFQPDFCPNHSDQAGRYAFNQQPSVGLWNLSALAQALLPLTQAEPLKALLDQYAPLLNQAYAQHMRKRLGLERCLAGDQPLVSQLLQQLANHQIDYNGFFRQLSDWQPGQNFSLLDSCSSLDGWLNQYQQRLEQESNQAITSRQSRMRQVNPKYLLRTSVAQQAIDAAEQGNYQVVQHLAQILAQPFDEWHESEHYAQPSSTVVNELSCSS